jgi:lysophosphatidylcholine acyltransferase/lyso-PAF acetyltransferase
MLPTLNNLISKIPTTPLAIFLYIYTSIILIYSIWLYKKLSVYYRHLTYKKFPNGEPIDVGEIYEEFQMKDNLSFLRIFLGNYFIVIIRGPINIILAICQNISLKSDIKNLKNPTTEKKDWEILSKTISKYTSWLFFVNGIKIINKKLPYIETYKKYLGPDYKFTPNEKYSLIISNHLGFYDVVVNMIINSSGFIAKSDVENYCFVGAIAKGINCLFVKRDSQENRDKVFEILEERQKKFYEGKLLSPLCLFPEGTTTSGRHILKFKKGAFYALLPIKPELILIDQNDDMSFGVGVSSVVYNYLRSLCYLRHKIYFVDLPVIKPTNFMWENYNHLGKEKWEVFAEVTRKILCEISGLKPSNKNYRDSLKYEEALYCGEYKEQNQPLLS